jgi:hypothetical protein
MPLRFVLDEHLRGTLWHALQRHNAAGVNIVDVTRIGGSVDLPLGTLDPDLLLWAERERRILVTRDWNTMPGHLFEHLRKGHHSPGVVLLQRGYSMTELVSILVVAAYAGDPTEFQDQVRVLP